MEEGELPLPASKGTYNIDFDNLDDFNPFQSTSKMGFSPPKTDTPLNPFQSRGKLRSSPPLNDCNENQIKSEDVNSVTENSDVMNTADTENQSVKGTKNPRSPEEDSPEGSKVETDPIEMSDTTTKKEVPGSHDMEATNQMAQSLEMVHEFGAGEMPEEDNEGFATAQAGIDEQSAWEMLDKYGTEEKCEDGEVCVYDKEFVQKEKTEEVDVPPVESSVDPEDLINSSPSPLMTTPKASTRVPKHPAARVLEENLEEHGGVRGSNKDGKEMTEAKSPVDNNIVHLVQVLKYSQSDVNKIKQELELDFQARLLNKEREWSQKLGARDKVITELQEQNKLYKATNEDMRAVVAEFEKTIAQLHTEKERSVNESQQTFEEVEKERDQALEDLQGVEASFSDLHRRYEKTKGVVEGFKKNEEVLKKCIQDYQSKLKVAEDKLQEFVQQAETKIDSANNEMERTRKAAASDIARLEAAVKKAELQVQSLQRSLDQKVKENEELTSICDELIAKVGS